MPEIKFQVDTTPDENGKICVKQLKDSDTGDNVVVVTTGEDGSIKNVTRVAAAEADSESTAVPTSDAASAPAAETTAVPAAAASDTVDDTAAASDTVDDTDLLAAATSGKNKQEDVSSATENKGGFSMKSLSRGLFGTKKRFMKKSTKKGIRNSATLRKRSIRRNSPTRRNSAIRRKSKRAGKRR
jgi:hypothetical protein